MPREDRTQSYNTGAANSLSDEAGEHREKGGAVFGPLCGSPQAKYFPSGYILLSSVRFILPYPVPSSSRSRQTFSAPPYSLSGPVYLPSLGETLKIETSFEEKTV